MRRALSIVLFLLQVPDRPESTIRSNDPLISYPYYYIIIAMYCRVYYYAGLVGRQTFPDTRPYATIFGSIYCGVEYIGIASRG